MKHVEGGDVGDNDSDASIRTPADFIGDAFQQAVVRDLPVSAKIPDLEGVVTRGCGDQG